MTAPDPRQRLIELGPDAVVAAADLLVQVAEGLTDVADGVNASRTLGDYSAGVADGWRHAAVQVAREAALLRRRAGGAR